jgi:release factor glutamine methyltransferase
MSVPLAEARRYLISELRNAQIENPFQEADLILARLLNFSRAAILGHPETILTCPQMLSIKKAVKRRVKREPLQYILGETCFYGRSFETRKGALIPRPETELLVELALEFFPADAAFDFLDWGTGSGCIGITLLLERFRAKGILAEKNPESLILAWNNLSRHRLFERSLLWHSRNPDDIPVPRGALDLVLSNPPYIPRPVIPGLMRDVRDYEPRMALDGGPDGLDYYRLLFHYAPLRLKPGGYLLFEIGNAEQSDSLKKMTPPSLEFVKEVRDYAHIPRCLAWKRNFQDSQYSGGRSSFGRFAVLTGPPEAPCRLPGR